MQRPNERGADSSPELGAPQAEARCTDTGVVTADTVIKEWPALLDVASIGPWRDLYDTIAHHSLMWMRGYFEPTLQNSGGDNHYHEDERRS